jgi:hypothetical protein
MRPARQRHRRALSLDPVGSEGMSEGMRGDGLLNFRIRGGSTDGALKDGFVQVVAANFLARWVCVGAGCRKDPFVWLTALRSSA